MKSILFVDGFNLYHQLDSVMYKRFKWLDLFTLGKNLIAEEEKLSEVLFFTAYPTWSKYKKDRHKLYVRALQDSGVQVIKGKFILVDGKFTNGINEITKIEPEDYLTEQLPKRIKFKEYEEKRTDVNLAIRLLDLAYSNSYDHAYIISADSDFVPAINMVKKRFPGKNFTAVLPPEVSKLTKNGHTRDIVKECHNCITLTSAVLESSQFPPMFSLKENGKLIERPKEWKV